MGIVEILAAVMIVISVVKLVFVFLNLDTWLGFARRLYSNPGLVSRVMLAMALIVLYLLILSGMTILQILAVCLFLTFLIGAGVAPLYGVMLDVFEKQDLKTIIKSQKLYLVVWLILLGWGVVLLLASGL